MSDEDDVKNRLGQRFETASPDEKRDDDPETESEPESDPAEEEEDDDSEPQGPEFAADITNVRETFDGVTVYIPSDMHRKVDKEYQRLVYETEWEFQKSRHFQPLLIYYGYAVIESLEGDEVIEYLRRMDQ